MRKLVGVMVVAAGATGIVVAGAPGQSPGTRTVVLTEVPQGRLIGVVDNPPRAPRENGIPRRFSTGDTVAVASRLEDAEGRRAGRLHLQCTITVPGPGDRIQQICSGVLRLADGLISFATATVPAGGNAPTPAAVTGGTGAYDGARGTLSTQGNRDGTATHTLSLIP